MHLANSLNFYKYLKADEGNLFVRIFDLFNGNKIIYRFWPPFVYLVTAGLRFIFGHSLIAVKLATSSFYFIILILSVHFLGYYYRNVRTGIFSAFLVSMYAGVFGLSREYLLDFPLVAMVSLCILFFLKSDAFKNRLYAVIFGLTFGISILTKPQAAFFILPVVLCFLAVRTKDNRRVKLKNFLLAILTALTVTSVWFYGFWSDNPDKWSVKNAFLSSIFSTYTGQAINFSAGKDFFPVVANASLITKLFSINNWIYYLNAIILYITPIFAIIFVFSVYFLCKSQKAPKELLIWVIVPYLIFSFLSPKDARYLFPAFPAITLLTVVGVENIKKRFFKNLTFILIFVLAVANYYAYSYLGSDLVFRYSLKTRQSLFYVHPPFKSNYQHVVKRFMEEIGGRGDLSKVNIGIISPPGEFDFKGAPILTYYMESYKPDLPWKWSKKDHFFNDYKKYNFLMVVNDSAAGGLNLTQLLSNTGYLGQNNTTITKEKINEIVDYFESFKIIDKDEIINEFDKKNIFLYQAK
ncbi:MAG: glycosyltransferase family 39 protein [Candidatus Omnitrophica bacterium]|nr:glycosyltransferase family 39 protein [Candidatus Omnitrophota bacterium]